MTIAFPDPRAATLAVLRALAGAGVTCGTRLLEDFPEGDVPALPYIAVNSEVPTVRWPVMTTAPMRLIVWHETEVQADALAWALFGALCEYPGGGDVRGFGELGGPVSTTDDVTKRPLSTFSVNARLKPHVI
ncbi:hypothetical protein AB0J27_20270 [Micromonospora chokoriensis]